MATAGKKAYLSASAYAYPMQISEQKRDGEKPHGTMHVVIPHGKTQRSIVIDLSRDDLLTIIANAADALRLLDREEPDAP